MMCREMSRNVEKCRVLSKSVVGGGTSMTDQEKLIKFHRQTNFNGEILLEDWPRRFGNTEAVLNTLNVDIFALF